MDLVVAFFGVSLDFQVLTDQTWMHHDVIQVHYIAFGFWYYGIYRAGSAEPGQADTHVQSLDPKPGVGVGACMSDYDEKEDMGLQYVHMGGCEIHVG